MNFIVVPDFSALVETSVRSKTSTPARSNYYGRGGARGLPSSGSAKFNNPLTKHGYQRSPADSPALDYANSHSTADYWAGQLHRKAKSVAKKGPGKRRGIQLDILKGTARDALAISGTQLRRAKKRGFQLP